MAKSLSASKSKGAIRLVPETDRPAQAETSGSGPNEASARKADSGRKAIGPKGFDIEAKALPAAIVDAAFRSGDYPYGKRMKRKPYERELAPLQIELQKLATWVRNRRERIVIVFEGRDGAGKGGTIGRFTQHLNPRQARVVALSKPSDTEAGQWYFQRYATEMPTAGEITFFDRSWYCLLYTSDAADE